MDRKEILKIALAVAVVLLAFWLSSCKTRIIEVPIEKTKYVYVKDTLKERSVEYDSIYINDSTYIERYDSLLREFRGHYEIRYEKLTDTVEKVREVHDSTRIEVPVEVPVEKQLTFWEKVALWIGTYLWWIIVLFVIIVAFRIYGFIMGRR